MNYDRKLTGIVIDPGHPNNINPGENGISCSK